MQYLVILSILDFHPCTSPCVKVFESSFATGVHMIFFWVASRSLQPDIRPIALENLLHATKYCFSHKLSLGASILSVGLLDCIASPLLEDYKPQNNSQESKPAVRPFVPKTLPKFSGFSVLQREKARRSWRTLLLLGSYRARELVTWKCPVNPRITGQLWLEGTSEENLVQLHLHMQGYWEPRTVSGWLLSINKGGDVTTSLSNLWQWKCFPTVFFGFLFFKRTESKFIQLFFKWDHFHKLLAVSEVFTRHKLWLLLSLSVPDPTFCTDCSSMVLLSSFPPHCVLLCPTPVQRAFTCFSPQTSHFSWQLCT